MSALWPTGSTTQPHLSDNYGPRPSINGSRPFHYGVDIPMPRGAVVHAAMDGEVIFAGSNGTLGQQVVIQTAAGQFLYPHMETESLILGGSRVRQSDRLGLVGTTGNSTGPHVCFRTFAGSWRDDSAARNPVEFMDALNGGTAQSGKPAPITKSEDDHMVHWMNVAGEGTKLFASGPDGRVWVRDAVQVNATQKFLDRSGPMNQREIDLALEVVRQTDRSVVRVIWPADVPEQAWLCGWKGRIHLSGPDLKLYQRWDAANPADQINLREVDLVAALIRRVR